MPSKVKKRGANSYLLTVTNGYDAKGKQIAYTKTVTATSPREANRLYNEFAAEVQKGNVATSGKMTLGQFYEFWKENFALKKHAPTTLAYNDFIFVRIKEGLGHKRLDKIEPKHLLAFYKNLAEPGVKKIQQKKDNTAPLPVECLSANTIKKHHALLSALFNKAVQWNMIPYSPANRVEPPKVEDKVKNIYSQEELGTFLQALENEDDKYRLMVLLALTGGLRREEIFGLEWDNIDFINNTVRIIQASVYVPETGTLTKEPKNKSSNRMISIPASVINLLRLYKTKQNAVRLKLGDKWQESGRVFTQWNGLPAHPHSFNKWLKRFTTNNNLPHVSPHSFRHMAASYLIASGTDVRTVSGKLGHAKTSTTLNIYSHLLQSAEQETANTMENFLQATTDKAKENQKKQA